MAKHFASKAEHLAKDREHSKNGKSNTKWNKQKLETFEGLLRFEFESGEIGSYQLIAKILNVPSKIVQKHLGILEKQGKLVYENKEIKTTETDDDGKTTIHSISRWVWSFV